MFRCQYIFTRSWPTVYMETALNLPAPCEYKKGLNIPSLLQCLPPACNNTLLRGDTVTIGEPVSRCNVRYCYRNALGGVSDTSRQINTSCINVLRVSPTNRCIISDDITCRRVLNTVCQRRQSAALISLNLTPLSLSSVLSLSVFLFHSPTRSRWFSMPTMSTRWPR